MSTTLQSSDEVFPGYVLTDRLGSGGYAEVWRARAPGGIDKAIKFVYGYYDEELAAQEMKAMERIKDVRHPFLLSLERFEVIGGRLAILTELADMSLDERARQCRAEGHLGIPREELLGYMSDAAEALDYLRQKHGLQHLDIKPENLLISGDHIKVADFGLVKELTTRSQNSLVAGMTPTYASPEMFDDTPSPHSDQYSLAIVYQEMLVGTLPFPGRTAAQLAKQHTQADPQLFALPAHDRPSLLRALAKRPEDRFPSCRAFIQELIQAGSASSSTDDYESDSALPPRDVPAQEDGDTERALAHTTQRVISDSPNLVTEPIRRGGGAADDVASAMPEAAAGPPVIEEVVDVPFPPFDVVPSSPVPTLYIAIGGVGIQALCRFRSLLAQRGALDGNEDIVQTLALDTDRNELKDAYSGRWKARLLTDDGLHLPLRLPKCYDEDCRESLAWLSRRWLYNIPRSLETRGFRPLGRLALVDNGQRVRSVLEKKLSRLIAPSTCSESTVDAQRKRLRVVLLCGTGGGTGTGMVIDVANAVRAVAEAGGADVEVHALLLCTTIGNANSPPLAAANAYALLTELCHTSSSGNCGTDEAKGALALFESGSPPFDGVYCVPVRNGSSSGNNDSGLNAAANYLAAEATTSVGQALAACRRLPTAREAAGRPQFYLRTLGCAPLHEAMNERTEEPGRAADESPSCAPNITEALRRANAELMRCGFDRRTLVLVPTGAESSASVDSLRGERPTAVIIPADVDQEIVICEGAGVSPRSLTAGLSRIYPGLADAARRLMTRIDIRWQGLA